MSSYPLGFNPSIWRRLQPDERLYLKGVEVEESGEAREGVYQELARGYGAFDYADMLASQAANAARLKTPTEFGSRDLGSKNGFGSTLLRQVLYAVYATATNPDRDPQQARNYLRRELDDYWNSRASIVEFLKFLEKRTSSLPHWANDRHATRVLLGSIENDTL